MLFSNRILGVVYGNLIVQILFCTLLVLVLFMLFWIPFFMNFFLFFVYLVFFWKFFISYWKNVYIFLLLLLLPCFFFRKEIKVLEIELTNILPSSLISGGLFGNFLIVILLDRCFVKVNWKSVPWNLLTYYVFL